MSTGTAVWRFPRRRCNAGREPPPHWRFIASGEPYTGTISGRLPLVWTHAKVVCDSPNKKQVEAGARGGRLMSLPVADTARAVQSELQIVTPYFVPADQIGRAHV